MDGSVGTIQYIGEVCIKSVYFGSYFTICLDSKGNRTQRMLAGDRMGRCDQR